MLYLLSTSCAYACFTFNSLAKSQIGTKCWILVSSLRSTYSARHMLSQLAVPMKLEPKKRLATNLLYSDWM
jgi:hypothetical protein